MALLSRVEALLEGLVEGGSRRLFRQELQPIEITHALERQMAGAKIVGPATIDVPNRYRAQLHPADFERLSSLRSSIERDAAVWLERRAEEQGFRPIGPIRVELVSDPSVRMRLVRCTGLFDAAPGAPAPIEHTRRIAPVEAHPGAASQTMLLMSEDGRDVRLERRPLRLGRATDNDFVVRDARVSRYHAVIEPAPDGWVVRDLESTNGTFVAGQRVDNAAIHSPVEISLGGYRLAPPGHRRGR